MKTDYHHLTEQLERVHTGRIALRSVALSDAWPLYEATRDPLFNMGLMWDQPASDAAVLDRIDAIMAAARGGALTAMSAVIKETGEWVSLYRFQPYAADRRFVEMGIWTHKRFWHGQYSLELSRACIDAAFALTDIPLLIAAAYPTNPRSCKILELCGLQPTNLAIRRKESGVEVELREFRITRAEWAAARTQLEFSRVAARSPAAARPVPQREPEFAEELLDAIDTHGIAQILRECQAPPGRTGIDWKSLLGSALVTADAPAHRVDAR